MTVNPREARYETGYRGDTYYFCSEGCMNAFNSDPEHYLKRDDSSYSGHDRGSMMGGCCGMGMRNGWMKYLYIGFILLYLVSLFIR